MVIPKNPVETVGINKTLPSRGSNCCFEKNPYLKVRIRNPLVQLHPLSKCKRRLGGTMSREYRGRGVHRHGLSSGVGCCPGVLGTSGLTLGGRAFWNPWCTTQEKPVATMELCPVAPIRQNSLGTKRGRWLGRTRSLFHLAVLCGRESEGSWAPGQRAHLSWPKLEVGDLTPEGHLGPLP